VLCRILQTFFMILLYLLLVKTHHVWGYKTVLLEEVTKALSLHLLTVDFISDYISCSSWVLNEPPPDLIGDDDHMSVGLLDEPVVHCQA
jgi:hypothetical protein